MLRRKQGLILIAVLLVGLLAAGCTGDDPTSELIEGVEGPSQVIVDHESDEFVATAETGSSYAWQIDEPDGKDYGYFTASQNAKTKFVAETDALDAGTINIRVVINGEPKDWMEIEVLGEKSETEYAQGTFHGIATTKDRNRNGYIAAGTLGPLDTDEYKEPYMVKSDNRGITIDEKQFNWNGRFYDVQDVVKGGFSDYYYLIGYGVINGNINEAFAVKLNNKMEVKKQYKSTDISNNDAYLRSGIVSTQVFSSDHIIAVGNRQLDNDNYAPYVVDINAKTEEIEHNILSSNDFPNPYYNLSSIVEIDDNGYLAVGFTNPSDNSRHGTDVKGIILELDSDFNVQNITEIDDKLYKIKKVEKAEKLKFVAVGENSCVVELGKNGEKLNSIERPLNNSGAKLRDVFVDEDNYVVVGENNGNGIVAKIDSSNNFSVSFEKENYGDYLYGIDKATDGDYLLAGHINSDGTNRSYVVKVDPTDGTVVNRIKE